MKKIIAIIFILLGVLIILYPKISNIIEEKNQTEVIKEYQNKIEKTNDEEKNKAYKKANKYNEMLSVGEENFYNEYNDILNLENDGVMAYIEIPKISVYLPIYHGTESEVLKNGIGHLQNTSLPVGGNTTHTVLTGHTGFTKSELFTRIDELKMGDEVYIFSLDKKMRYCVYQIKVVLPYEINDLKIIDGKDLLTLVTCTPYGINTHRLLVQCEREEINESDKKIDIKEDFIVDNVFQSMNDKYWIFIFCDIIIFLIIVFCCILLNKIVKYIQKVRNKE